MGCLCHIDWPNSSNLLCLEMCEAVNLQWFRPHPFSYSFDISHGLDYARHASNNKYSQGEDSTTIVVLIRIFIESHYRTWILGSNVGDEPFVPHLVGKHIALSQDYHWTLTNNQYADDMMRLVLILSTDLPSSKFERYRRDSSVVRCSSPGLPGRSVGCFYTRLPKTHIPGQALL